ncbi:MAG: LuxR C-terminal-related transcriptional regulator [Gammaproteobacteria bacterium]|nr:LuxR C-terminal-related transcriptional regulator [Gammaproteobacteria bacterium]
MSDQIAQWLVSAKVSPPRQFINVCRRQSLLQQLKRSENCRVVWIEAPAGFGKTLLVSQWREEALKMQHYAGWVSIDGNDEPEIFIPYLAYSLHLAGLDMLSTRLLMPSFQGLSAIYSLGRLLRRIESSKRPVVMIFDDCENASAEIITQIFEPLLRLQPDNLRIVFTCRKNPGLPLSGLSVQGRLLTIDARQLCFNADEIVEFFGGDLDRKQQLKIAEITGGWPVALQLIRSFGAEVYTLGNVRGQELNDYLREQLVDKLPDDEKEFLLDVSILNPVSAARANAIREATDSNDMIKRLHYLGGIFSPLEDNTESYRIHPLVREFLQAELETGDLDRFLLLNKNHARWLAQNAQPIDAIRAALTARQVDLAVTIFEKMGGLQLFLREGMPRLRMALALFEGMALKNHPRVQLARSLIHAKNGQIKKANEAFQLAMSNINPSGNENGQDDTALLIDRFIAEVCLIEYGCAPAANALSRKSLKYIMEHTAHDPEMHGCIATMQCLLHLQAGSFERCTEYGLQAIESLTSCNQLYGASHIHFHLGMAELANNRLREAQAHYEEAVKVSRTRFPGDLGPIFVGDVVAGELYWELGDRNNASKHLKRVIAHPKNVEAWFDIHMAAYQTAAQYLLEDSGLDSALLFLERENERAESEGLVRLSKYLSAVKFLIHYLAGDIRSAVKYCAGPVDSRAEVERAGPQSTWRETEILTLVQIRRSLFEKNSRQAARFISALLKYAEQTGNARIFLYGMVQKIILENLVKGQTQALVMLAETLEMAGNSRYLRPFLQERDKLSDLLAVIASAEFCRPDGKVPHAVTETAGEIINLVSADAAHEDATTAFSVREVEILVELAKGHSDKLIGRSVGISAHGVRYHLKNIYFKMGVENRLQAINRARETGLIDTLPVTY